MTTDIPRAEPSTASVPSSDATLESLAELAKAQAQRALAKIPVLGAVSWLMLQQADTRNGLISDLESRVLPPLLLEQSRLFVRNQVPVAFATWAFLSPAIAARYQATPHRLGSNDWRSGDQAWLIDLFAPHGGAAELLGELRQGPLAGKMVKQLVPVSAGSPSVLSWPPLTAKSGGVS